MLRTLERVSLLALVIVGVALVISLFHFSPYILLSEVTAQLTVLVMSLLTILFLVWFVVGDQRPSKDK